VGHEHGSRATSDLYERLGIDHDADAATIRSAYRRLAFTMHPDRVADRTPFEQARAARRMAELNEAVAVLGDPERRAAYDRRLAGGSSTDEPQARPAGPASWDVERDDLVPVAPEGPTAALLGYLPWLLLVVVMIGIFVFTAYSGGGPDDDADPGTPGATVEARDIRGSCIRTSGGFVLVANCAQTPHEGQIVALASDAFLCPEGLDAWEVPQEDLVACADPATAEP
jgi:DnaJ-domain-containing protein 1